MNNFPTKEDWEKMGEESEDIEGIIFKIGNVWVTNFRIEGRDLRCRVDYNPWTGERL